MVIDFMSKSKVVVCSDEMTEKEWAGLPVVSVNIRTLGVCRSFQTHMLIGSSSDFNWEVWETGMGYF